MTCLMVGAMAVALSGPAFTLSWTHSVEKTVWAEDWRIVPDGLMLGTARVKGSGAGMEPGEGAVLLDGWWVWHPETRVPSLRLAASGATIGGWQMCDGDQCLDLGATAGEALLIAPCAP